MDQEQAKAQYRADQAARAKLTEQTMTVTAQSKPTPTQEENDLLKLGLMHPDEKVDPGNPEMPPPGVQQEVLNRAQSSVNPSPKAPARAAAASTSAAPASGGSSASVGGGSSHPRS
jgi:hypothetical protein